MMQNQIDILLLALERILHQKESEADFVELAATGEALRRSVTLCEDPDKYADEIARYEERLASLAAPDPKELQAVFEQACAELRRAAATPAREREPDEALDALDQLDEALAVAAAAARVSALDEASLSRMAEQASALVREEAPRIPETWDMAFAHQMAFGPDPDFFGLDHMWQILGALSPDSIDFSAALATPNRQRKQEVIEQAMKIFARQDARRADLSQRIKDAWQGAKDQIKDLLEPVMPPLLAPFEVAAAAQAQTPLPAPVTFESLDGQWEATVSVDTHEGELTVSLIELTEPSDSAGAAQESPKSVWLCGVVEELDARLCASFHYKSVKNNDTTSGVELALIMGDDSVVIMQAQES